MNKSRPEVNRHTRIVRTWLWLVAGLIFFMVLVGGATRLTESGLSIVQWRPVTGALPPISDADWQIAFEQYKTIPQYKLVNRDMTLNEFKVIFWWEWTHRLLGRLIGFVFLLPFLWFLWRKWIEPKLRAPLWGIFGMGAFQGAVGWWMVSSGLADRVSVSQYRLAFHLTLACIIYVAILWAAELCAPNKPIVAPLRFRVRAGALLLLTLVQIYLGSLVAGLRAGLVYNTWPTIDNAFIPDVNRLFFDQPLWRNFFENALTVQFDHRMMAYILFAVSIWHAIDAVITRQNWNVKAGAVFFAGAVTLQAVLGILTLLFQVPILLALAHQGVALITLTIISLHAVRLLPIKQVETDAIMSPPMPVPNRQ